MVEKPAFLKRSLPVALARAFGIYIGIVLTALISACERPVIPSDLPGEYVADYTVAHERLILKASGEFIQQVTFKPTGKLYTTNGTWRYDAKTKYIDFPRNFILVLDGFGHVRPNFERPASGLVAFPVEGGAVPQVGAEPSTVYVFDHK